jgi:hypothetical protein
VTIKQHDIVKTIYRRLDPKSKATQADIREVIGILSDLIVGDEQVDQFMHKHGLRRHMELVRKGKFMQELNTKKRK